MIRTMYTCDKCGEEIKDVYYTLTCFAGRLPGENLVNQIAVINHNIAESKRLESEERHLCKACKDAITDGVFIV